MSLWIVGTTRSGKTTRLVQEFQQWLSGKHSPTPSKARSQPITPAILVFAANDGNRRTLADRLASEVAGSYPLVAKTPLGFIADEVTLFWPLLFQRLNLKAQFPLRLRPETEQELATQLWRSALDKENLQNAGITEYRFIRQTLDLLQLAGASGISGEDIPQLLQLGFAGGSEWEKSEQTSELRGKLLLQWRQWCLERGLLSYGIIYELYWRYLLDDRIYQKHLRRRFQAIFADDTDDYPAIAKDLFDFFLDEGIFATFTYNPNGQSRRGLNADPEYLKELGDRCDTVEELQRSAGLAPELADIAIQLAIEPVFLPGLPPSVSLIQAISRSALLRQTAEIIIDAIQKKQVQPGEIAIIAPGLDAIARYTLMEIFTQRGIAIEPLNEQRPLISSPLVRALLTLLTLIYPGLGRLVERETVGEMLVILSRRWEAKEEDDGRFIADIDPVRAGILADRCYYFDLDYPHLKPGETYPRWDRLGHRAMNAYEGIRQWIEEAKRQKQSPRALLDRAMKDFLWNGSNLTYPQLAALRELMEAARHFWETDRRLRQNEPQGRSQTDTIAQFIQLLRRGTITANARPARPWGVNEPNAITLATIFQYRSLHRSHPWHFWLDAGSSLWQIGGATELFASHFFLKDWSGFSLTPEDRLEADKARLARILWDLLARTEKRLYLCHSDLAVNGTEQTGPLLSLVHAALPLAIETL
ncbi:MAG: recombinase family protein [Cyanobacteria bacterium SBLK]|nr:recombinase family protein [Cyanobacteria bacterium SBLK]